MRQTLIQLLKEIGGSQQAPAKEFMLRYNGVTLTAKSTLYVPIHVVNAYGRSIGYELTDQGIEEAVNKFAELSNWEGLN